MALWIALLGLGLVTLGIARPQTPSLIQQQPTTQNGTAATILKSEFINNGDGTFRWEIETSDGIKAEQSGVSLTEAPGLLRSEVNNNGTSDDEISGGGESVKGSYSYKAPDGQLISLSYVADKNGFQPVGSHIPTPPPNPFGNSTGNVH